MHELGIAQDLLNAALATAHREGATRVHAVIVQIGELAGVVPEALQFAFTALQTGTAAGTARLEIEWIPAEFVCPTCGSRGESGSPVCPACARTQVRLVRGRELQVVAVDVE